MSAAVLARPRAVLAQAEAEAFLFEEAACLDERRWSDWVALFRPDAEYCVPSWRDDETLTRDPDTELSLIYFTERTRLEERIWRITSGQSPAAIPLPRTLHCVSNVRVAPRDDGDVLVRSNFVVQVFQPRRKAVHTNFGTYTHVLAGDEEGWRIRSKRIVLLNDYMPASVDVNTL